MHRCAHKTLQIRERCCIARNQKAVTIRLKQCNTRPLQRVGQVVDYGLWNVGPLLFQSRASQICSLVQSACWPCKNWSQTILEAMVEGRGRCAYSCSMAVRQVGCPAKWSEMTLETTYNKDRNVQSMASSSGVIPADSTPTVATCVALCCLIKLHILEWPFTAGSSPVQKDKCSLTQI